MSSSHQTPAARKAASSQQATLDALAVIALDVVQAHLAGMTTRLAAALADVEAGGADAPAPDSRTIYQRVKSGRLLRENSYAFVHLAAEEIGGAVRAGLAALSPQAAVQAASGALGLVPLDEIDGKLAFAALARPFDIVHAESLAALAVRLGLRLGRGVLRADANPFRPAVFLQAIDAAWRAFEPDVLAHELVMPLLAPAVVFDFAPLYEALVAELRKEGRPQQTAYHIQKNDDGAVRAARASHRAALAEQLRKLFGDDGGDEGLPLIPVLPDLPGGKGDWRPSAGAAPTVAVANASNVTAASAPANLAATGAVTPAAMGTATAAPEPARAAPGFTHFTQMAPSVAAAGPVAAAPLLELLARLDLQAPGAAAAGEGAASTAEPFYLPRWQRSLPAGSLGRADERTLDLLARVFETVLLDDAMPAQARDLLRMLQVPVLKAALLDRNFFYEDAHPARRLVDLLSRMGWEQRKDEADPVFQAMRRSVSKVGRTDAAPADFSHALAELEAAVEAGAREEDSALQAAIAAPVASALQQERIAEATRAARDTVALRLGGGEVAQLISGFLEQRWTTVLTFAYTIEAERPGAVGNATRAMDDLIWSVQAKPSPVQRKTLISRLPRLLSTLNKWLDAIKWQDAERLEFFAGLAECHASIVRAPVELSPERQLELAVEAAQHDALRQVELEQAAAQQAALRDAARADTFSPLDGLERGAWLAFRADAGERRVKLAWVSPLRSLFIFSGADRKEAFSLPGEQLAAALHAGRARVLAIDGLVGQVLSAAMREGAVNDAAPARHASA